MLHQVGGNETKRLLILAVLVMALIGVAGAANYMYEKASVKGVGYKNVEIIMQTQYGFSEKYVHSIEFIDDYPIPPGAKMVEKEAGSGNIIIEKTELEAERQLGSLCDAYRSWEHWSDLYDTGPSTGWSTGAFPMDYINFTKEAEFEYMPVSYQTGTYDQKWIEKLCVQNYRIGAVLTEMYTHAEHLQKTTEVKTRGYGFYAPNLGNTGDAVPINCCTGVLEANLNSNVIGVAHIGWISRDPLADPQLKGRHAEYGRSVEDLTGVFSIEKFIQLWGNSTCGAISVDWLPCV
jgi:hypothetical protein